MPVDGMAQLHPGNYYRSDYRSGGRSRPIADRTASELLNPEQIGLQLCILMLLGPEVQGNRRQFIYNRHCMAVFSQVHRLDVVTARVARLDSDLVKLTCCINCELLDCSFATCGADNSSIGPLCRA